MERVTEPDLMLEADQVEAFANADFAEVNDCHVKRFGGRFPDAPARALALDVCCGPGDVTLRFARAYPGWTIHGVDGSRAMLDHAERSSRRAGVTAIRWIEGAVPGARLPAEAYDVVLSTGALHHFHDPMALWDTVRHCSRGGSLVFVVDFFRPASVDQAAELVERHAGSASDLVRRDYFNSLCAAFTPEELRRQLGEAGLARLGVDVVSDRHVVVAGRVKP